MTDETVEEPLIHTIPIKKETLCSKYDISLEKLSFEYVAECKNVKELERIVKILRSGEEGHYPDLQKCAEQRLQAVAPNSRLLRVEEPVVRREAMMPEERDEFDNDLKQWVHDMSMKDEELSDWNKNYPNEAGSGDYIPPIRRAPSKKVDDSKKPNTEKLKKPVISDYSSWDKYDADTELLKIDAEEERKKTEEEIKLRKQKAAAEAEIKKEEHTRLNCLINSAKNMPDAEKSFHALREKDRGNEYYKACNYDDAIDYYTASIAICPNAVAYNNRAASYLKQGKYDLALNDVNKCLELDPENTKGLYRRGLCLQHKNKFDEALQDMQAVLRKEPHNLVVQHVAKELRQQCRSVPRSVRMLVEEEEDKIIEISETEARGIKAGFEINEWGLARSICSCYGRPRFMFVNGTATADHLIYVPEEKKKKKKKKDVPGKEILAHELELENVTDNSLITEIMCNGDDAEAMDTNRIPFGRNADNEADELIPKKIQIIETVRSNNGKAAKEHQTAKRCIVKDMRGQKHVQGKNELGMTEQFNSISIEEPVSPTTSIPDNKNKILNVKVNQDNNSNNNNEENDEVSNESKQNRRPVVNYEFHVPSEKQPITIANKYTQKVGSNKNVNAQSDSRNINNINSFSSSNDSLLKSFQFFHLWNAIKDSNNLKKYAEILRRIPPSRLRLILSSQLDSTMLLTMLKTLTTEFDVTNSDEADLVKQYLVALSEVDRFSIIVQFLSYEIKQQTYCLIEKVGGEDTSQLMKSYMVKK